MSSPAVIPQPTVPAPPRRRRRSAASSAVREVVAVLRDLAIAIAVLAVVVLFFYQPVRVEGTSMLPVLADQERLLIHKFAFHSGQIQRFDVVVFRYPHDETKSYIKRVIGCPGDRVRIERGVVLVNGRVLGEPYVPTRFRDDRSQPELLLAPDRFFVMGDHRSISSDSRDFGPVARDLIYGKAEFVYWPVEQAGVIR